jgi:hypothetical protein
MYNGKTRAYLDNPLLPVLEQKECTERTVAPKMYMIACAIWFPGHTLRGEEEGVSATRCKPASQVYMCVHILPEGKVEGISLSVFGDQAIWVEGHWVLVYLGIMHEVPIRRS